MSRVRSEGGITDKRWLAHLERHIPIARAGVDAEGAHQMRVAIARLRVWLALGGWRVLDDDLRWLRDRIAPVRDLDVQLQHEPPSSWAAVLRRRHDVARRGLLATLEDVRLTSLLLALSYLPPVRVERARSQVPKIARCVLRRARVAKQDRTEIAALHGLRRVVRRLRFALEWLHVDTTDLVKVQDALGKACDFSVALSDLRQGRQKHLRRYRAKLARDLRRATQGAFDALHDVCPQLKELASCSSSSFAMPPPSNAPHGPRTRADR